MPSVADEGLQRARSRRRLAVPEQLGIHHAAAHRRLLFFDVELHLRAVRGQRGAQVRERIGGGVVQHEPRGQHDQQRQQRAAAV
ncbi:hypothetical protein D3C72_2456630 [compost metagenome]